MNNDHLTKLTTPFCLLSEKLKKDLKWAYLNGQKIELLNVHGKFVPVKAPAWRNNAVYRLQPIHMIPDSINWDHVHSDYNYMVRHEDGKVFLCKEKPYIGIDTWYLAFWNSRVRHASAFASYKQGNVDWKDSLVCRPGFK